jgi:hypothetical protein
MNGDVIIAGMFDIYGSENDKCSTIIPLSVKYHEAIKWTLRKLNDDDYITGVKLGKQNALFCISEDKKAKIILILKTCLQMYIIFQSKYEN